MRRQERAVTGRAEISEILDRCKVCRIAVIDGDRPYAVPVNFGYEWIGDRLAIYVHCAQAGRKLEALRANPAVCFEADCGGALTGGGDLACAYSYSYQSVIGEGRAELLEAPDDKVRALARLMRHLTGREGFAFAPEAVARTAVLRILCDEYSGKRN